MNLTPLSLAVFLSVAAAAYLIASWRDAETSGIPTALIARTVWVLILIAVLIGSALYMAAYR